MVSPRLTWLALLCILPARRVETGLRFLAITPLNCSVTPALVSVMPPIRPKRICRQFDRRAGARPVTPAQASVVQRRGVRLWPTNVTPARLSAGRQRAVKAKRHWRQPARVPVRRSEDLAD